MSQKNSIERQVWLTAEQLLEEVRKFTHLQSAGSILLLIATISALLVANTPLDNLYQSFKSMPVEIQIGAFSIDKSLHYWVNDGLMALFFLVVGLELKREFIEGDLRSRDAVTLPLAGAVGGMLVPALIYVLINIDDAVALNGWAIPAATDIAFALGTMALLGDRIPNALKVFLISLAIFDDIGAIIIIAIFYTENLSMAALITALVCCFLLYQFNRFNVSELPPYVLVGLVMWAALLKSGVHATLAGVIIAMFIPLRHRDPDRSPLREMERDLHAIVVFVTLPLFAFVNAGVRFVDMSMDAIWNPVTMGISAGLVIGKPLGIGLFCWLAVRLGWVKMPDSLNWTQLWSVACLCGIGFTMSLFIGNLAFESMPDRLFDERIGILIGSVISGLLGLVLLHTFVERATKETPQQATEI